MNLCYWIRALIDRGRVSAGICFAWPRLSLLHFCLFNWQKFRWVLCTICGWYRVYYHTIFGLELLSKLFDCNILMYSICEVLLVINKYSILKKVKIRLYKMNFYLLHYYWIFWKCNMSFYILYESSLYN